MVAGLLDRIEDIVVFDDVPAPGAFADVYAGARGVVDAVVAHGNVVTHGEFHTGNLFFKQADVVNEVVADEAVRRVVFVEGAFVGVDVLERHEFFVAETWRAYPRRVAHKADGTGADVVEVGSRDGATPVVAVKEDAVAAKVVKVAIAQCAVFGALEDHGAAPEDSPVGAQQRFVVLHEGADGLCQFDVFDYDVFYRIAFAPLKRNQVFELRGLEDGCIYVFTRHRIVVKLLFFRVVVPLSRGVELFKDVFHHAVFVAESHGAVVLPAPPSRASLPSAVLLVIR